MLYSHFPVPSEIMEAAEEVLQRALEKTDCKVWEGIFLHTLEQSQLRRSAVTRVLLNMVRQNSEELQAVCGKINLFLLHIYAHYRFCILTQGVLPTTAQCGAIRALNEDPLQTRKIYGAPYYGAIALLPPEFASVLTAEQLHPFSTFLPHNHELCVPVIHSPTRKKV